MRVWVLGIIGVVVVAAAGAGGAWLVIEQQATTTTTMAAAPTITTTVPPTTTTTVPPTTTTTTAPPIVEKNTWCPQNTARSGRKMTWYDDRTEEEIWDQRCGGIQTTTTTPQTWHSSSYIETLSDERTYQAALYLGDEGAYLFFVCPAATNVLEITIWGAEVPTESALDRYTRAAMSYRIGDNITDTTWTLHRQDGRYSVQVLKGNRGTVINQFRNRTSDHFAFRVNVPGLPTGELFDIGGFEDDVEPVLEACDW